jgi:antitoxin (DNA-binding transcriptional repressor) of toxin-antitoxin stability system
VGKGESYTVTSRGKPVARMVPAEEDAKPKGLSTMFDEMNKLPGLISGPWKREDLYDR